ncbi:MAG: hypothetical protein ABIT05_08315 [Chitinophagaceae bacterium]
MKILLFVCCIITGCKGSIKEDSQGDIKNKLLTFYKDRTGMRPDSVTYTNTPKTERDIISDQADYYMLEAMYWRISDYSQGLRDSKSDEYKMKEDSCNALLSKADTLDKKYYELSCIYYIGKRNDSLFIYMNPKNVIIPRSKLFDIPKLTEQSFKKYSIKYF